MKCHFPVKHPITLGEISDVTRRVHGTDFGISEARWLSRFHSDERQAPQYRVGRVFLAGDAAHVHSPAGGQGMNTGLQDAANLSWKLAATVTGHGEDGLLDSYQRKRHPVGEMVLRSSGALIRMAMLRSRPARLARSTQVAPCSRSLPSLGAPPARSPGSASAIRERRARRICPDGYVAWRGPVSDPATLSRLAPWRNRATPERLPG
ncbi:FAD-dependent monooxygenase [Actinoplanes sp. CA-015351]|uniref:FAD-dependent monooxygenase n=1 Tax=Actinoplanes sp. CA-015351 TaxID=3239897 RepID=UPI003D990740